MNQSKVAEERAAEIARKLSGPHYQLGAAFRCAFMMNPPERLFPCDFLTFRTNGLVEEYDGKTGPRLTPLGVEVRERLAAQAIEARQGGDAKQAPSQDESAVGTMRPESTQGIQP